MRLTSFCVCVQKETISFFSMRHDTTDTVKGHRKYIIIVCDLLLFFAMLKWLPVDPTIAKGLAILTFIGILWLTEALHVTVTALMVPVLAMIMGILPGSKALAGFADPTIFLFFGGFALAGALHEQKIDTWMAEKILRMAKGRLWMALILIFLSTAFLSMWMSNTATAAMMLPLVIGLLDRIPEEKTKTIAPFAILGVAYSASIGGIGTLVGSPPNAIAAHELSMGFAEWFRIAMPVVLFFGLIVFSLMYLFFRPRLGGYVDMAPEERAGGESCLNAKQVRVLILFVLVAGSWMCSSSLSSLLGGISSMDTLIALCAAVMLPLCGVINWSGIAKNTDWGVLLLFGGGITLSAILVQTGAARFLADQVSSLAMGQDPLIILLIISLFITSLTEFCSNTASAALVAPLMVTVADAMGMSAVPLVLLVGIGASCAFMLPVSTPPNALAFATGRFPQMTMVKVGLLINVVLVFVKAFWARIFWM